MPLYCLGAQMFEVYPVVPLSRNLTINVAVLSYCGAAALRRSWATAPPRPTSRRLAGGIEDAFAELEKLALLES